MKPIKICNWEAWVALIGSVFPIGLAIYAFDSGMRDWRVWVVAAIGVFCFVAGFLGVNHTFIFSEEGITSDGLFGKKTVPWRDVIQVKTLWIARYRRGAWKTRYNKHLGFTFRGGEPLGDGQNPTIWMLKNLRTSVNVPYREDLEKLVLQCYGPLDDKVFWEPPN